VRSLRWTIRCEDRSDRRAELDRVVCSATVQIAAAVEVLPVVLGSLLNLEGRGKNEFGISVPASERPTRKFGKLHAWLCDRLDDAALSRDSVTARGLHDVLDRHLPPADAVVAGASEAWFWALRDLRTHLIHHPKSRLLEWRERPSRLHTTFTSTYLDGQDERRELSSLFRWFWGCRPGESGLMPLMLGSLAVLEEGLGQAGSLPL
jgi:hypothetical protein